jgi:DNA invertase Pin-like site-specific DNA recombinase
MLIGYARVSTEDQNLNRQIDALLDAGIDRRNIYKEKVTGTKKDRPMLTKMIDELQEGDTVIITELTNCQWPFENPHFWPRKLPM